MKGLPLKSSLKLGLKKTIRNILPIVISVLLCAACAMLFAYAEAFWQYDRFVVEARTIKNLNEEDYKYQRYGCDYGTLVSPAADYLIENYSALKFVNFIETDFSVFTKGIFDCFIIDSYEDILSFGYTFYGDYEKTLTEGSAYVTDSYLKELRYCFYENGEWEMQDYRGNADTSAEWFSSFVGKSIYPETYDKLKIEIAGVVNTGYYDLSFRDLGLEGEDEYENSANDMRNDKLSSSQKDGIGYGFFGTEAFVRSYAIKVGVTRVGARPYGLDYCVDDGRDVSFALTCETTSFNSEGKDITVLNDSFVFRGDEMPYGRIYYKNDKRKENVALGEGEMLMTMQLYKDIFDEEYNYEKELPSHIGEKISLNITVDGKTYEIKDKIFAGVYNPTGNYYGDDVNETYGIVCPGDEVVSEIISDYSVINYLAVVNIGELSESELAELLRAMDEDYNSPISTIVSDGAKMEAESVSGAKDIYMVISAVLFVLSLLFGVWNVLHTVKRDYREIGILRANGVTSGNLSIIYSVQFVISGILSFIISLIGVNMLISNYVPSNSHVINYMLYFPEFTLYWVGIPQIVSLIVLNLVVPLLISLFAFFRVRKVSPVEAINEAKRNE